MTENKDSQRTCACIIPFYNEGERVFNVLKTITQVKALDAIFCVDDGSSDTTYQEISKRFPTVQVIRIEKNSGKSAAVYTALKQITQDFIFMIDADLSNLRTDQIENAVTAIKNDTKVDMIIMNRLTDPWFSQLIRGNVTVSGERMLRRTDLLEVFKSHPKSYQIEYAINYYMMDHHKTAYWMPFSGKNFSKIQKNGFLTGFWKEVTMHFYCLMYKGPVKLMASILFFCKTEYHPVSHS